MITKDQTKQVINWLNNNLAEINSGNESHSYWRLRCSKELGFVVSTSTYNNRLHQVKYNKVPKDYRGVLTFGTDPGLESTETIVELTETDTASASLISEKLYDLYKEIHTYEEAVIKEIEDLKAKLALEVENNKQLVNSHPSQNQIDNQAKIIATLKDDKNKEFIRLSSIIAEQKETILTLRSECEILRDKVNDLEITKAVSKNTRSFKEFGFNFNIPQPSCKI